MVSSEFNLTEEELRKVDEIEKSMSHTSNENDVKKYIKELTIIKERAFVRNQVKQNK